MRSRRIILLGLVPALLVIATFVWLGAFLPGQGEAQREEAATTGVKAASELLALRQPRVGEGSSAIARAPASDDSDDGHHDKWTNTSNDPEKDKVQTIVNNSNGVLGGKDVYFTIENKGDGPVRVGTSPQRGDFSGGSQQLIPPGARERVHISMADGEFLLASCQRVAGKKCDWTISHLTP